MLATTLLAGCTSGESTGTPPPSGPQVVATLEVTGPFNAIVTPSRLWLLGGPSRTLTEVDPTTNTVTRVVRPPHPSGWGAYVDGSLWLASYNDNLVMQLDADTGRVRRVIEPTRAAPLNYPVGVAVTGTDVWVVGHEPATLTRIDARTGVVTASIRLPGHNASMPDVAAGQLWIALTHNNLVVRVNPATGRMAGSPIRVDTGTCSSSSVVEGDIWYSSVPVEDWPCKDAARRINASTGALSPVIYGAGKSLEDVVMGSGSMWATDKDRTLYSLDVQTGALQQTLTFDEHSDSNRLVTAFGSIWVLRDSAGQLLRLNLTAPATGISGNTGSPPETVTTPTAN